MFIYGLSNPINNEIFYVGKTNDIEKRYKQHYVGGLGHNNRYLRMFIVSIRCKKLKPGMIILETCEQDIVDEREKYWINYGSEQNWPLTNTTYGKITKKNGAQHQIDYISFLKEKIEAI